MKKTILIAGGASLVSLVVGSASGYLVAKKRFANSLPEIIERETEGVKKHYSMLLMSARSGKPASIEDLAKSHDGQEDTSEGVELTPREKKIREKGRRGLAEASKALTDYRGISTAKITSEENTSPNEQAVETQNVFDKAKKQLPPRDPSTGAFRKRTVREEEYPPELIDEQVYLLGELEHEQEALLYFINDKTLVSEDDPTDVKDIAVVGEVNLTLFPEEDGSIIYVRNAGLSIDYEIKKKEESLTDYIGLGGDDGEETDDESRYV